MRHPACAVSLLCGACSFHPGLVPPDAHSGDALDARDAMIDFLPEAEETFASTNWNPDANVQIDTTAMTIAPSPPSGVTFQLGSQDNGAPIAILRANDVTIGAGRIVTVTGDKPLAILAAHDVTIIGVLDVAAHGAVPGPGGALPAMGTGAGGVGVHDNGTGSTYDDAGGGGGSFSTAGARGGNAGPFQGGAPGLVYVLDGLLGGSGGGAAGVCGNSAGAGGGALLIYADHKIGIDGSINAGGGGGGGGLMVCATGSGSGAGGGSGGTIWLQSIELDGTGVLAANGGGGGGGSYININNGGNGEDGKPSTTSAALGGPKANTTEASVGGNGAIVGAAAPAVAAVSAGNAGGGGGGLGRIVFHAPTSGAITSSPAAVPP